MPSTKDATLDLIQREINEVVQREKELRENYSRSNSSFETVTTNSLSDDDIKPPLERAKSVSYLTNGNHNANGGRLFTQNITTKGVMHRFIKSRGRISAMNSVSNKNQILSPTWTNLEITEPAKVPSGIQPRNGFVPVEERIRREFHDMEKREIELRVEREKSQPDLLAVLNSNSPEPQKRLLRSTVSVSQLNEFESYDEILSAPASLKGAKSLSDLCDIEHEEEVPPGSHSLIKQWENLIKKNQTLS